GNVASCSRLRKLRKQSMGSTVKMLPLFWVVLDLGVYSLSLPEISDSKFIDECVTEHNIARSSVNPPATNMLYMTWDQGLAITARAWARHCVFEHNIHLKDVRRMHPVFPSVGENIWTGYPPSHFNVSVALKSWVNEKEYYDYQTTSCTKICGHYTQATKKGTPREATTGSQTGILPIQPMTPAMWLF
ncbi:unnamed protein product, partial [Menidia menidia]